MHSYLGHLGVPIPEIVFPVYRCLWQPAQVDEWECMGQIFRRYVRMWLHTGSAELWAPRNPQWAAKMRAQMCIPAQKQGK